MTMTDYAFCKGLEYPSIVEASQRVAWTVDNIFANRGFDTTRRTVPDSWVGTEHLAFLGDSEKRTLTHIRALVTLTCSVTMRNSFLFKCPK